MAAVLLAGFCTFLDLYATQPILPLLMRAFHVPEVEAALTVSVATFAVALTAPIVGMISDRVGRRPVITFSILALTVPTFLAATASTLPALLVWRFLQGCLMPGIFAITVAYVSEEWAEEGPGAAMSAYVTGTVLGGFTGRFLSGMVAEHWSWRVAFVLLGVLNLAGAIAVRAWLPPSRRFTREAHWGASLLGMASHLRSRDLLSAYAVGFNVLFSLVATFTYVTFHLSAPPYRVSNVFLAYLFTVYLVGAAVTPIAGRWIDRFGHRLCVAVALGVSSMGALLTLAPNVWAVAAGLALCCSGVFVCQSASSSYVGLVAGRARSSAVGLYVTLYYVGGTAGGILPGLLWKWGGWTSCVVLVVAMQVAAMSLALTFWRTHTYRSSLGAPWSIE